MSPIELTAVAFGLAAVWLTTRQNIWCWPTGLVQVLLSIPVFYDQKLYSDLILHVFYAVLQVYGWYHWLYGRAGRRELPVSRLTPARMGGWLLAAGVGTAAWGRLVATYTDADLPYWDAGIAVFSLLAQYLMTRKVLENWLVWMLVDVVAVGVFGYKGLYAFAGLYAVFLIMCVYGLVAWTKDYRRGRPPG